MKPRKHYHHFLRNRISGILHHTSLQLMMSKVEMNLHQTTHLQAFALMKCVFCAKTVVILLSVTIRKMDAFLKTQVVEVQNLLKQGVEKCIIHIAWIMHYQKTRKKSGGVQDTIAMVVQIR